MERPSSQFRHRPVGGALISVDPNYGMDHHVYLHWRFGCILGRTGGFGINHWNGARTGIYSNGSRHAHAGCQYVLHCRWGVSGTWAPWRLRVKNNLSTAIQK